MSDERPQFLNQTANQRDSDSELQAQLKAEATARGIVPTTPTRHLDFVERSIAETERNLLYADDDVRGVLEERLEFLRDEHTRMTEGA